jgi:Sucrase/ferredoxin-like
LRQTASVRSFALAGKENPTFTGSTQMSYKGSDNAAKKARTTARPVQKMSFAFKSLIETARQTISGASTPAPGTPKENTPCEQLFKKVEPAVDGEDCEHDCGSCIVSLSKGFKIDEDDKLYGYVKGWSTHVLVATGKTDWVRDVADEKGSVMEAIGKKADAPSNGVSNTFKFS